MHTGARDLSACIEPRHRRAAMKVRANAAAGVVGRWRDRDEIRGGIQPELGAVRDQRREAPLQQVGAQRSGIQIEVIDARARHHARHLLGDDIARREVGERVRAGHNRATVRVDEDGAFAAQGFRDEWLAAHQSAAAKQCGGMELNELEVGDGSSRAQRQGDAVSGRDIRVSRGGINLAHASGGQDNRTRCDGTDAVATPFAEHVQRDTTGVTEGIEHQVEHEGMLDGLETRVGRCGDQRPLDFLTGRVTTGVDDTTPQVPAFAGEFECAVLAAIEVCAQGGERVHLRRTFVDKNAYGGRVAQSGARGDRVGIVRVGRIIVGERSGDTALRPPR